MGQDNKFQGRKNKSTMKKMQMVFRQLHRAILPLTTRIKPEPGRCHLSLKADCARRLLKEVHSIRWALELCCRKNWRIRNKKSPSMNMKARYNPTNIESQAIGSPSYAYQKNKDELITSDKMKPAYYSYMQSPGNPMARLDGGPAFKGRDYAARYDPYRDANLGNARFIPGEGKVSPARRVGGAFSLFWKWRINKRYYSNEDSHH